MRETPPNPVKSSRPLHSLAHFGLQFCSPAAEDFQEAVNLVRVAAEAGQQEMEVGQFGNAVLADVIGASVGQWGDGLGFWPHLGQRGGRWSERERERMKGCFKNTFHSNILNQHKSISVLLWWFVFPHLLTLPDRISRPSPRLLECSCSSRILLEMLLWDGWTRLLAELDRSTRGSCQAWSRERANDNRSDSCRRGKRDVIILYWSWRAIGKNKRSKWCVMKKL